MRWFKSPKVDGVTAEAWKNPSFSEAAYKKLSRNNRYLRRGKSDKRQRRGNIYLQ